MQVVRKFLLLQTLPIYINHPLISLHVKRFCEKMFNKRRQKVVLDEVLGNVDVLGCGTTKLCTVVECYALSALGHRVDENTPIIAFNRFSKNGMHFCTEEYRAGNISRNNELVLLPENKVGKLLHIFLLNNHCVILIKQLTLNEDVSFRDEESQSNLTHIKQCTGIAPEIEAVDASDVVGNCIAMHVNQTEYIGLFPNYVAFN